MFTLLLALAAGTAHASAHAVLFVGNSYTQYNAPDSIDGDYAQLLAEGMPAWEVDSRRYARGGYTLSGHLGDAQGETELRDFLTDTEAWSWDLVVLQDQSQIPGFPPEHSEWMLSLDASVELAEMITAAGAQPRLFMTWGRRDGDSSNPARFPDYPTMQGMLASGYYAYAEAIVAAGYPVEVVPVGMAWQHIYDAHTAVGEDPLASSSLFSRLYSGDGSHPSVLGSYMASLVFYAAFTGQSPVGLQWAPDAITERDRDIMQAAAAAVMADAIGGGEDTGDPPDEPADSADPGEADSGDDDSGVVQMDDESIEMTEDSEKSGCGCATARPGSPWMFGLLLVGLRRRRS